MFNQETKRGLAPKSWTTVAVWLVLAAVFVSRPVESTSAFFGAVKGTGAWVGYNVFADCGDQPPMEWMEPKVCPSSGDAEGPATGPSSTQPEPPAPAPSDGDASGYVVTLDGDSIRSVLDRGTNAVLAVHGEVEQIQDNGGLAVEVGNPQGGGS